MLRSLEWSGKTSWKVFKWHELSWRTQVVKARRCHEVEEMENDESLEGGDLEEMNETLGGSDSAYWRVSEDTSYSQG